MESLQTSDWFLITERVLGSLSCIGSGLIIISFFVNFKKISPAYELIFYLSLSSFINPLSYMLLYVPSDDPDFELNKGLCFLQGSTMIFSELSLFLTATTISYYLYKSQSEGNQQDNFTCEQRVVYLLIIYGIPLLLTLCCITFIGQSDRWCWIDKGYGNTVGLLDYVLIWAIIILNIVIACKTYRYNLNDKNLLPEEIKNRTEYIRKLCVYPIISFTCWLPATLNRMIGIYNIVNPTSQTTCNKYTEPVHMIFILSQGFLYFLASAHTLDYLRNLKTILASVKACLKTIFCCWCCKKNPNNTSAVDIGSFLNLEHRVTITSNQSN